VHRAPRPAADRLVSATVGATVRLRSVEVPSVAQRRRLAEFGLRPGALVTVLARTAGGGRLVGLGVSRIVLDAGTAAALGVSA
jgi:ferrous iron transport protein A